MTILRIFCTRSLLIQRSHSTVFNLKSAKLVNESQLGGILRIRTFLISTPTRLASSSSEKREPKFSSKAEDNETLKRAATRDTMFYVISLGVIAIGLTFAAIPAYRMFCEATSFGGLTQVAKDFDKIAKMEKNQDRLIRIQFNADTPSSMRWNFKPLQHEIYVHPGETALAFYSGKKSNRQTDSAYYFNKIQCFCFEEQILNPGEEVELPVFFYIDPDYANDPALEDMDSVLLSYTFFEAKNGLTLPSPFDPNNRPKLEMPLKQMAANA
ncbi:Cytochrome c oxidase assembly protein COX11, mitochondrial [Aphelenchoides bicaudatus]|nr:Cytochrome c oxidase assembly protein COX11, mitochondrial [Aphelenchoides bicaudatus]